MTVEDLTPYFLDEESIKKEKKSLGAQKVFDSIQAHRKISLSKFIAGFDIEGVGEVVVDSLIAGGFNSLEKILGAREEEIASVYRFAEITARTLVSGLRECESEIRDLVENGVLDIVESVAGKFTGKSFCFTGELKTMKRADAQNLVKENGGAVKSSVVKGLSYLVTNDTSSGSSKNRKAAELGIPVINEQQFLELLK